MDFKLLFYISAELALLLLIITAFLIFHVAKMKKTVALAEQQLANAKKQLAANSPQTAPVEDDDSERLSSQETRDLEALVQEMTGESERMLATIEALERENQQLQSGADTGLQQQLASTQQELLNLKTQHIELEERYQELKAEQ